MTHAVGRFGLSCNQTTQLSASEHMQASYYAWLQQYADPNRVFCDVDVALQQFPSLKPRTDNCVRVTPPQLLIVLSGVLPVVYGQQQFGVPVELWLPKAYPRAPPMAYVVPAPGMAIRPGQAVAASGQFMSPYLDYWASKPDASLWELVRVMQAAFAQEMPVYAPGAAPPQSYYGAPPMAGQMPPSPMMAYQQPAYGAHQYPVSSQQLMHQPMQPRQHPAQQQPTPAATAAPAQRSKEDEVYELKTIVRNKVLAKIKEREQEVAVSTDRLMDDSTLLNENDLRLDGCIRKLQDETSRVEHALHELESAKRDLQRPEIAIGRVDVESLMQPQGVIPRQLVELTVREMALVDCLYAISNAFFDNPSMIGMQQFVRSVRSLAREQFLAKALILKIRRMHPVLPSH